MVFFLVSWQIVCTFVDVETKQTNAMEGLFREEIETRQVDMFFANEMGRQIHRYIKAMHGSLAMLEKFEARMKTLTVPQRGRLWPVTSISTERLSRTSRGACLWRAPSPTIATRSITLSA